MPRVRTCIGCRRRAEPDGWVRIAVTAGGAPAVGAGQPGRGAWVCSVACFDGATRRKALDRALRRPVSSAEIARLRATLLAQPFVQRSADRLAQDSD